jgi:hypothetical protein
LLVAVEGVLEELVAVEGVALEDLEPPLDLQYCPELRTQ